MPSAAARTRVVNLYLDSYDVYIGRGPNAPFGNPFPMVPEPDGLGRVAAIQHFQDYFLKRIEEDDDFRRKVLRLKGKTLGCFCAPRACHGDIIAEWVDANG